MRAVEIRVGGNTGLDRRLDQRLRQRRLPAVIGDAQRPADTVMLAFAPRLVLGLAEEGQDGVPVPALAAALPPAVIVGRRAANVDHRSEEQTSELPSLMRISYAVLCLKKKT